MDESATTTFDETISIFCYSGFPAKTIAESTQALEVIEMSNYKIIQYSLMAILTGPWLRCEHH